MLSSQIDQHERREVQRNEQLVRQGSTLHQHALADAATPRGRFPQDTTVTSSNAVPQYPAASSPWQGPDLVGQEPPLGFSVDAMPSDEPSTVVPASSVEAQGGPADAPPSSFHSPLASEPAGSSRLRRF
jgi:hypothetical protein